MGIIKSARELALERAAELTGDIEKEAVSYENEQYIKAASLLAGSYLKGTLNLERLAAGIGSYPPEAVPESKKALLKEITAALSLNNCEQILEAYREFKPECKDPASIEALAVLYQEYLDHLASLRCGLEQDGGLDYLLEKGISGSAIAGINLDLLPQWREAKEALSKEFSNRLQEIKQRLTQQFQ